jgi:hypothetical protein
MLNYLVNHVFEALNVNIVSSNCSSAVLDELLHLFLSIAELLNGETKLTVNSVEGAKFVVHLVGLERQVLDICLSWRNVLLQLLNLVVKHKLELLQLLSLLFEAVDNLLPVANLLVLFVDFLLLVFIRFLDRSNLLLLLLELGVLVLNGAVQVVDLLLNLNQLVAGDL